MVCWIVMSSGIARHLLPLPRYAPERRQDVLMWDDDHVVAVQIDEFSPIPQQQIAESLARPLIVGPHGLEQRLGGDVLWEMRRRSEQLPENVVVLTQEAPGLQPQSVADFGGETHADGNRLAVK